MPISLIAAVARNGTIGREGRLPWRLPADLARFKQLTLGHVVLMGRRTWESLGRPLPGRANYVMSRDPSFAAPGCTVIRSFEEGRALAAGGEIFVIGGAALYAAFMPLAARLFITHIDTDVAGDTVFPRIDPRQWRVVEETPGEVDRQNPLPHRFTVYERIAS
ncbi:MAG: dihydrofolate reductase [Spirochaetes bacterium]|nr:dihydrofolate reductase [Spirochaetota bacterium]